jgi:RecA/RadA recombinase
MANLLEKLKNNSTIKETDVLSESKIFNKKDLIQTSIPMINVALSGRLDGGLSPGLTVWAGPSKHFKTLFTLILAKAYLDKYPDSVLLFYDSEFGSPQTYFDSIGIPTDRVLHTPITDIEQLKHDVMLQLNELKRGDRVIIVIDSVGNLASKKEVDDAIDGKSVADMSRAKQMKSLFRMVTPHLTIKDIPMVVVNHTYKTMELYSRDVVSGGTGIYYAADNIYIIGRQQEKDGTEVVGYNFIINVEKSRYTKEKTKIPMEVSFEGGLSKWSGLMEVALNGGFVFKPANGWYSKKGEDQKFRLKDTYTKEFWMPILESEEFQKYIEKNYMSSASKLINQDLTEEDIESEYEYAAK